MSEKTIKSIKLKLVTVIIGENGEVGVAQPNTTYLLPQKNGNTIKYGTNKYGSIKSKTIQHVNPPTEGGETLNIFDLT